jgi:hypothetical protein
MDSQLAIPKTAAGDINWPPTMPRSCIISSRLRRLNDSTGKRRTTVRTAA